MDSTNDNQPANATSVNEAFQAIFSHIKQAQAFEPKDSGEASRYDQRKLALAKTNIEQGLMWLYAASGSQPALMTDNK